MTLDPNQDLQALVRLDQLTARTSGRPEVQIGLIDGPIDLDHPGLASESVRLLVSPAGAVCSGSAAKSSACAHGTFVAGILTGRRGSGAPALCPDCTLLVRPIFTTGAPGAVPHELAAAIRECVDAGAHLLNLSLGVLTASAREERLLQEELDRAAQLGILVIAAAGNEGAVGSSVLTRHPWVVPVVACAPDGRPLGSSNLGSSIGRRGIRAPGERVRSLGSGGALQVSSGTSVAAPFVTGTLALLRSLHPEARPVDLRSALGPSAGSAPPLVPVLLDAEAAETRLSAF